MLYGLTSGDRILSWLIALHRVITQVWSITDKSSGAETRRLRNHIGIVSRLGFRISLLRRICRNMGKSISSTSPVESEKLTGFRCITSPPRIWNEVPVLFSPPVSDVFSGGIAFSYFPTSDGYGMVTFSGDDGQT